MVQLGSFTRYKPSKSEWPWPFKATQGKIDAYEGAIGLPIYYFLSVFNSNVYDNLYNN